MLIGRMTARPEVRDTKNSVVANFTLAVDRRFTRDDEQSADFIRCVAFGKTAEFIEKYMDKGSKVAVCEALQQFEFVNAKILGVLFNCVSVYSFP